MFHFKINNNVKRFLASDTFYWSAVSVVNTYLSVLVVEKIAPGRLDIVGMATSAYLLSRALLVIPLSLLTTKFHPTNKIFTISASMFAYGALVILLGRTEFVWQIIVFEILLGLLDAFIYPLKWNTFTHILDKTQEEFEWGIEDCLPLLASAAAAFGAGLLSQKYGIESTFTLFGFFFMASGVIFYTIKTTSE